MRGVITFFIMVLFTGHALAVGEWKIVKREGRDYVHLETVGKFYQLGNIQMVGSGFTLRTQHRSLRGSRGSRELYINNLKFILSYPIAEEGGKLLVSRMDLTKLIEPVMRPSRISSGAKITTVVLDAGHGGHDHGAQCVFGKEKDFTLDVALRARALLQSAGFRVVMTRSTDVFIPLEERARIANRHPNALFISIHFNSSGNAASGVETFTLAPRGVPSMASDGPKLSDYAPCPGNVRDTENIALACATHAALVYNSKMFDRGIKRARFVVIRDITIPGVLLEGGFLSNPSDARRIATTAHRQQMAGSILQAVRNYRNAVGGPRPPLPMVSVESNTTKRVEPTVITPSTTTR
jgi:N-acetylmuramoyl-L-alanine amidase